MTKKKILIVISILVAVLVIGCSGCVSIQKTTDISSIPSIQVDIPTKTPTETPVNTQENTTLQKQAIYDKSAFSMHVIDMGQGDAILLEKDGKYAMIDAGETSTPSERDGRTKIFKYLDEHGVKTIEFLLLTHQDYDHIGSALDLIKNYNIKKVYDNGFPHTTKTYLNLMTYILENDVPYQQIREGDKIESPWKDVTFTVLSPPQDLIDDDTNHNSIVLKVTYGDVSMLLTGDAEKQSENYILSTDADISAQILKAGHHGSKNGSTNNFLNAVSPETVIISAGTTETGNSYGHPHTAFLKRIVKVVTPNNIYRTDIDGSVVVTTDGKTYSVTPENTERDLSEILFSGQGELVNA